jgi:hypothetical protein
MDGTNSLGHLALKHANAFPDHGMMLQDFENNFGADMVGEITDNTPASLVFFLVLFRIKGSRRAGITGAGQGIPTKKIPDHLVGLGKLMFQKELNGILVHFGEPQTIGQLEEMSSELPGPWPYFKEVGIVPPAGEGEGHLLGESHIGQEMLTQLLFGANAVHGPAKIG